MVDCVRWMGCKASEVFEMVRCRGLSVGAWVVVNDVFAGAGVVVRLLLREGKRQLGMQQRLWSIEALRAMRV